MESEFLNPEKVLDQLDLSPNMIAADFGSGAGGWALPLAKRLKEGKVFAIDIQKEPLSALEGKAKAGRIFNIQTIVSDLEEKKGSKLGDNFVDLVLMTNLLFQLDDIKKVLEEGKRVLKKGGKILIVDWIKDNPLTPEIEWVDFERVKTIAKEIGLKMEKEFKTGTYHHSLILIK
jgi:ubiquinone/menaquinone biosynthesis C-methylase UbiE